MYVLKDGKKQHVEASVQKSIRIDKETYILIESVEGRSFSAKIRKIAEEYKKLMKVKG